MTSMEKFCHFWSIFLLRKKVHTSDQIVRPKFFWWKISSKKNSTDIGIKISRSRRIFKRDWILSPSWPHIKCLDFTPPPPPPHCPSSFWKIYPFCPEPALLFRALLLFVRITKKHSHAHKFNIYELLKEIKWYITPSSVSKICFFQKKLGDLAHIYRFPHQLKVQWAKVPNSSHISCEEKEI